MPNPDGSVSDTESAAASSSPDREAGLWRFSVSHFLIALVMLIVSLPFVLLLSAGPLIETALMTAVLQMAVAAVGGRYRTLVTACVLVTPPVVGKWVDHFWPNAHLVEVVMASAIVFLAFVVYHLLRFILLAPTVDPQVLCAGVATYLVLALLWSFAYALVSLVVPDAFQFSAGPPRPLVRFESLYFSFMTLTTVGYGDITPISKGARMLAMLEATIGTFYITMLIARLVALYSQPAPLGSSKRNDRGNFD